MQLFLRVLERECFFPQLGLGFAPNSYESIGPEYDNMGRKHLQIPRHGLFYLLGRSYVLKLGTNLLAINSFSLNPTATLTEVEWILTTFVSQNLSGNGSINLPRFLKEHIFYV